MNDNRDHLRALLAAYCEPLGLSLMLSTGREKTLREVDKRGITPAELTSVVRELQRRVNTGVTGYTEACLTFENVVGKWLDVDRLENRVQMLREKAKRRAGAKSAQRRCAPRAETVRMPDGGTVSRAVAPLAGEEVPVDTVKREVAAFFKKMKGGQG